MTIQIILTKKKIEQAEPREQEYHLWDAKFRGLGLRVHPSGTKSFILKKRTRAGRQVKLTIGRFGDLTIEQARQRAVAITNDIGEGNDPAQSRQELRRMTESSAKHFVG